MHKAESILFLLRGITLPDPPNQLSGDSERERILYLFLSANQSLIQSIPFFNNDNVFSSSDPTSGE